MKNLSYLILLLLLPVLLFQCKKQNPEPIEQLPSITQTRANTFGCLLNGQAWTPRGNHGSSNYIVSYDPTYREGTLNISTYRYINDNNLQYITIASDSIRATGNYPLTVSNHQEALFIDTRSGCEFLQGQMHFRSGNLTIAKLDLNQGIISGTFEFTLAKPGCDTIKVTNGRFDKKL